MEIILYTTNDDNNRINKSLDFDNSYDIKLKSETSILKPTIILQSKDIINSNYAYIEEFERYYYIDNITIYPNKVYHIDLECDVLMSFKDDILNSYAYIEQNTKTNKYYNSGYQSEVKKEVDIYKSDIVLEKGKSNILVTIGGV